MALTEQQTAAIERLRENESLTGNLTDKPATAVLTWAEEQIKASAVYEDVVAAVKAANRTGAEDVDEALGAAQKSLATALAARGMTLTPPAPEPAAAAPPAPSAPPTGEAAPASAPASSPVASAPEPAPTPARQAVSPPPAKPGAPPAPGQPPARGWKARFKRRFGAKRQ